MGVDGLLEKLLGKGDDAAPPNLPDWQTDELPKELRILSCFRAAGPALPSWSYHKGLSKLMKDLDAMRRDGQAVPAVPPLTCTCGPGVLWAWLGLATLWTFFVVFPWLAYMHCECPEDVGSFAVIDDTPLMPVLGVVLLVVAFCQFKCLSMVVVSQLDVTKNFDFNGFSLNSLHYGVFVAMTTGLMGASVLDMFTNGEILARALRTRSCSSYDKISAVWSGVMRDSAMAKYIPGYADADFVNIVLVFYWLMLLQPLFTLIASLPMERGVTYSIGFGRDYKFQYRTLYDRQANHGGVLQMVAEGARMEAVLFQDSDYALAKMDIWYKSRKDDWQFNYQHLATVELGRAVSRFFLKGVLQTALQTSLQISIMGIYREATGKIDSGMVFSVIVTLFGLFTDFPDAIAAVKLSWKVHTSLPWKELNKIENATLRSACLQERSKIRYRMARFCIYMLIYACMLSWSFGKVVAYSWCKSHLWNVGSGCAPDTTGYR